MTGCEHCGFGKDPCLCDLRRESRTVPPPRPKIMAAIRSHWWEPRRRRSA